MTGLPDYIWARELHGKRKFEVIEIDYHTRYIRNDKHWEKISALVNENADLKRRLERWEPSLDVQGDGTG